MNRSPIKWAGGKARVMPQLLKHLPKADCLIEPFVGSGTVFMNTDYRSYILCDSNRALINFFRALASDVEILIRISRMMFTYDNNEDNYSGIRQFFNSRRQIDLEQAEPDWWHAAAFLYLNRHGFNGLFRVNQKGEFNVPFGKYAAPYFPEKEMRLFAEKVHDTQTIFLCGDFRHTIPTAAMETTDAVIYCDPPYLPASKTASFTQYHTGAFTKDTHRQLVAVLLEVNRKYGAPVVISNSDTKATRAIYHPFKLQEISVQRSISADKDNRQKAKEVIGVLPVCGGCGRHGAHCPDCVPCAGYLAGWGDESDSDVLPGYWESEENPIPL